MTDYMTMTADSPPTRSTAIKLYDESGFAGMRKAGRLAAEILDALVPHVVPGVTTGELDDIVRRMTIEGGGVPATMTISSVGGSCMISPGVSSGRAVSCRDTMRCPSQGASLWPA